VAGRSKHLLGGAGDVVASRSGGGCHRVVVGVVEWLDGGREVIVESTFK
jgi:hypothetical protein